MVRAAAVILTTREAWAAAAEAGPAAAAAAEASAAVAAAAAAAEAAVGAEAPSHLREGRRKRTAATQLATSRIKASPRFKARPASVGSRARHADVDWRGEQEFWVATHHGNRG